MIFRFSLQHDSFGTIEISEPLGWETAKLKLTRDPNYHSLVEEFDIQATFYGNNGVKNGGISFIKQVEQSYGVDAELRLMIEMSFDDGITYPLSFIGLLSLDQAEENNQNQITIPVIPDDTWTKFFKRRDISVNVQSEDDLDGNSITPGQSVTINLPSQKVRYVGEYNWLDTVTYPGLSGHFGLQLDWEEIILDDIKKFSLPRVPVDIGTTSALTNLIGNFEAPFNGDYTLDIRIESADYAAGQWFATNIPLNFWVQNVNQTVTNDAFSESIVTYGSDVITINTYNKTLRLKKGDQIVIFGFRTGAGDPHTIFGTRRLSWKTDCVLATTNNITLSGEQTIDGTLTSSSRVLVKNQGNSEENGIYVSNAGVWVRASDSDTEEELINAAVYITSGTTNADSAWRQDEDSIDLGNDPIIWVFTLSSDERFKSYPGPSVDNHLIITADTTYRNSQSEGFLIHDLFAGIVDRIVGENNFYSEIFGSQQTNARVYDADGCFWNYILCKGLQLRQYSLDEKPFFQSFNQCWNGSNPIFNLGLGLETIDAIELPSLNQWLTSVGVDYEWTIGINNPFVNLPGIDAFNTATSEKLYVDFAFVTGETYTITIFYNVVAISGNSNPRNVAIGIYDNSFTSQFFESATTPPGGGEGSITITFTANSSCTRIGVLFTFGANRTAYVTGVSATWTGDSQQVLRIEEKAHFYDQSSVSVNFSNIQNINRNYDLDVIYNKITVGYKKWESENISGIDDPQSKRQYVTRFKTVGDSIELLSDFIAASLAIETTRRSFIEQSKDHKFDNDTFIIALKSDDSSPDEYDPELDEKFDSVTNLLNADTRYNLVLTPLRNLLRWANVLMGALQQYLDSSFKFVSGEGNYDMISDYSCTLGQQCVGIICDPLSESQDIPFTNPSYHINFGYLHLHYQYDITVDMSYEQYKAIRDNRNLAIGISQTDANHVKFFIKSLEYEIKKGEAKISAWPVTYMDLEIIEQTFTMQCAPSEEGCEDAITDEFGEELTDELGVCITFV